MSFMLQWVLAALCLLPPQAEAAAQAPASRAPVIRLASSEWPPYVGKDLSALGASTAVIRAALATAGYQLQVDFFPWRRTIAAAGRDSDFVGYFPEYMSADVAQNCLLSKPIGTGPLGFAERADMPIRWQRLDELSRYTIGVVDGYINTRELDQRVREHQQPVDAAHNDVQNLVKLAAGRVSLAVIDRRVFEYLRRNDPQIRKIASQLRFNSHLLEEKPLFVCFRRDRAGEQARRALNEGLKTIDIAAVMATALR